LGGLGLGGLSRAPVQDAPRRPGVQDEVGVGEKDYAAFERTLHEVQVAYSRQDVAALWNLATPEMAGYIQEELNENASKGVVNTVGNVRLAQGDLAEAWREGETDYATVAMRFAHRRHDRQGDGSHRRRRSGPDRGDDGALDLPPGPRRLLETVGDPAGLTLLKS
jgi:predicted lipid-binding transport protein (Tim44 family)